MSEDIQVKRWISGRLPKTAEPFLVLITGARQTGKTTTARTDYGSLRYFNLDAMEFRDQLSEVSSFQWGRMVGPAVFDEVQKLPAVLEKLKFAFDAGDVKFSVLLGSAQIMLLKKVRESLAGRILVYDLWPLTLSELITRNGSALKEPLLAQMLRDGNSVADVCAREPEVLVDAAVEEVQSWEKHLLHWGGMPGLLALDETRRREWLRSYEMTYLERDLGDLTRLNDLTPFRKFHQLAALRSGGLLVYSELARDAGISVETARRYLEYLRISYQAFLLPPFTRNLTSSLVKTPKLYWSDSGLWRQLTGRADEMSGGIFETYVVGEIVKYVRTIGLEVKPYFYRTRSGMEVDLLLQTSRGLLGIEIKAREQAVPSDATNLLRLEQSAGGGEWLGGLVVYRGTRIHVLRPKVYAVPSWRLLTGSWAK
jgi:predicted AAA+ superfamily ATPase